MLWQQNYLQNSFLKKYREKYFVDVYSQNTILKNVELFKINTVFFTPVFQFESSFAVKPDLFNKFWKQNGQVTEVIQVCVEKL